MVFLRSASEGWTLNNYLPEIYPLILHLPSTEAEGSFTDESNSKA